MKPYIETNTYRNIVAALDAEIAALETRKSELAGSKVATNRKNAVANVRSKLKNRKEWHGALAQGEFRYFTDGQCANLVADVRGSLYTEQAKATLDKKLARHEGRAEEATWMCLYPDRPFVTSQRRGDYDDGDNKWLDNGRGGIQLMQVSACGVEAYNMFLIKEGRKIEALSSDVVRAFARGELTGDTIKALPVALRERLLEGLTPENVVASYGAIYCAFSFGFVKVPIEDVGVAWEFASVTKGKPRYRLLRSYLEQELRKTLNVVVAAA